MKRFIPLLPLVLLVSCVHNPWNDVSQIYRPVEVEEPDPIVLVAEDTPPMEDVELPSLLTPHEAWLEMKEVWDEMELAKLEAFPGYEVQEYPVLDPDLAVEEETETLVEAIEEGLQDAPTVADEDLPTEEEPIVSEPILERPIDAFTREDRQKSVNVADTEVPDWFIYICTVLILATLVAMCYIAKQRKESTWYRRRGD